MASVPVRLAVAVLVAAAAATAALAAERLVASELAAIVALPEVAQLVAPGPAATASLLVASVLERLAVAAQREVAPEQQEAGSVQASHHQLARMEQPPEQAG